MKSRLYKVASLFAGIGGICTGFKQAGAKIAWANEWDKYACETYNRFFGNPSYLEPGDIYEKHIPKDVHIDIIAGGFPCQAFSIAGHRRGFEDERGVLYKQIVRTIQESTPKAVFLENVKNLMTHDRGNTYRTIREALQTEGFVVREKVMNTMRYGNIPQNRERVYTVAFKEDVPGSQKSRAMDSFEFPEEVELTCKLSDIINYHEKKPDKYYYKPEHMYYQELRDTVTNPDTVYQWRRTHVRENKSGVCPTLTANMGEGGHNVPIICDDFGIRKFTPYECLAFQGFPRGCRFPEGMADSHRYKQTGNSVSVPVVRRIAENMISAIRLAEGSG